MCVCIYVCWLSNRLVETYFYRNESVIEKAIWRTILVLHYTLVHRLIHIARMFWFLLGVSKRLKQFSLYERDLWHQKIRCTQNTKLIWKRCTYTSKPPNKMYFWFQGPLSCVIPFPSLFIPWMHVELRYTFLRNYVFLCTYVACDCVCVCSHVPCCCYFYAQGSSSNLSAHHEKIFRSKHSHTPHLLCYNLLYFCLTPEFQLFYSFQHNNYSRLIDFCALVHVDIFVLNM